MTARLTGTPPSALVNAICLKYDLQLLMCGAGYGSSSLELVRSDLMAIWNMKLLCGGEVVSFRLHSNKSCNFYDCY